MKSLIIVSAFLVALASAIPQIKPKTFWLIQAQITQDRGCLYIQGKCAEECPEGTHSYNPQPSEPWHSEPTCDNPEPEQQALPIADYSACYCDKPTVRDPVSNQCVTLDKCPKKQE